MTKRGLSDKAGVIGRNVCQASGFVEGVSSGFCELVLMALVVVEALVWGGVQASSWAMWGAHANA